MAESSEAPHEETPEYRIGKALRNCRGFLVAASDTKSPKTGTWSAEHYLQNACSEILCAQGMLCELDPNRPYTEEAILAIDKAVKACRAIYSCEISQPKPDYRRAAAEILEYQETVLDQLGRKLQTIARHVPHPLPGGPLATEHEAAPAPLPAAAPAETPPTAPAKAQRKGRRPFEGRKCEELRIRVTTDGMKVSLAAEPKPGPPVFVKWQELADGPGKPFTKLCFEITGRESVLLEKVSKATIHRKNKAFCEATGVSDNLFRVNKRALTSDAIFTK